MQVTHYDFTGRFAKMDGKRMTKWDLMCEIDSVYKIKRRWRIEPLHLDHLNYAELVAELKQALKS
jgi:hypothetical protein